MTIDDLKISILSKEFKKIYVFYGPEYMVQKVYINKIAELSESNVQYIDTISDISAYSGNSLFSTKKCFVCIDDDKITKSNNIDKDLDKLLHLVGDNILILQFTKLDKRLKFYNYICELPFCEAAGVEFELLHPVVLGKHLAEDFNFSKGIAEKLAEVCEYDYGRCLLEADKIDNFNSLPPDLAFQQLLNSGTIIKPSEDKIFEFVDAVLGGKITVAFDLLEKCKEINEPTLKLLSVLFTGLKHLLQVQSCTSDIADTTGLSQWEIRKVQRFQGVYKNFELVDALKLIQNTEFGIKTGQIEESMAIDYVLVNIF